MLLHLAGVQAQCWGNPRRWWCYADEGSIGIAVCLAESGVHPRTLTEACMQKYMLMLHLELF